MYSCILLDSPNSSLRYFLMGHVKGNFIITPNKIHLLHACEGNIKISIHPIIIIFLEGFAQEKLIFFINLHIFRTCMPLTLFYTEQHMIIQYTLIDNSCLTKTS